MKSEANLTLFPAGSSSEPEDAVRTGKAHSVPELETTNSDSGPSSLCAKRQTGREAQKVSLRGSEVTTEDPLLTVNEFADELKVTHACVRKWILERKVGVVKVGRLVRLRSSELRRILEQGSRPRIERM